MNLIEINGVRLEYERITGPARPAGLAKLDPLVFLHEGLGSVAMWRDWPAQLCEATGREGIVYSRRGYGQSDAVPDVRGNSAVVQGQRTGRLLPGYMHEEAFRVLPSLLAALGIDKPVLVGHSDGASIALLYASRFPVTACVVMAPHVLVEDVSIQSITQARLAFESGDLRARLARYHADVDGAFWQWNDIWLSQAFRSFDIRENCRSITAPLLAIQGREDPYGTLRQIEDLLVFTHEKGLRGNTDKRRQLQIMEQCGHSPQRDQAGLTTQLIVNFLQESDPVLAR